MKKALIVHNPTAGDGKHTKKELLYAMESSGYGVEYVSTHSQDWKDFETAYLDVIFLAGGDGTVHKLVEVLLEKKNSTDTLPIHVLPLGTANNIARTLKIPINKQKEQLIRKEDKPKAFGFGRIRGLKSANFFLESVGFGIFPELISEMERRQVEDETPSEELHRTLKVLLNIVKTYEPSEVEVQFSGIKMKGSFLMGEVMNTKFIGPNLKLAPHADPGDDYLDLVMVPEEKRAQLESYLHHRIEGKEDEIAIEEFAIRIPVQQVKIKCGDSKLHVDDDVVSNGSGKSLELKTNPYVFRIFENS